MIATLIFTPDGIGRGLYTEAIDLQKLGILLIERATSIEFDNRDQQWRVHDSSGQDLYAATSRQKCLVWEQWHFSLLPAVKQNRETYKETTTERTTPCR